MEADTRRMRPSPALRDDEPEDDGRRSPRWCRSSRRADCCSARPEERESRRRYGRSRPSMSYFFVAAAWRRRPAPTQRTPPSRRVVGVVDGDPAAATRPSWSDASAAWSGRAASTASAAAPGPRRDRTTGPGLRRRWWRAVCSCGTPRVVAKGGRPTPAIGVPGRVGGSRAGALTVPHRRTSPPAMLINCVAYQEGRKLADIAVEDISDYLERPGCFVWVALLDATDAELADDAGGVRPARRWRSRTRATATSGRRSRSTATRCSP